MSSASGAFSATGEASVAIQVRPNNTIAYVLSAANGENFIGTVKAQRSRNRMQWDDVATLTGTSAAPIASSAQQTGTITIGASEAEYIRLVCTDIDTTSTPTSAISDAVTWTLTEGSSDAVKAYLQDGVLRDQDGNRLLNFAEDGVKAGALVVPSGTQVAFISATSSSATQSAGETTVINSILTALREFKIMASS